jgi:hypothetical protein
MDPTAALTSVVKGAMELRKRVEMLAKELPAAKAVLSEADQLVAIAERARELAQTADSGKAGKKQRQSEFADIDSAVKEAQVAFTAVQKRIRDRTQDTKARNCFAALVQLFQAPAHEQELSALAKKMRSKRAAMAPGLILDSHDVTIQHISNVHNHLEVHVASSSKEAVRSMRVIQAGQGEKLARIEQLLTQAPARAGVRTTTNPLSFAPGPAGGKHFDPPGYSVENMGNVTWVSKGDGKTRWVDTRLGRSPNASGAGTCLAYAPSSKAQCTRKAKGGAFCAQFHEAPCGTAYAAWTEAIDRGK